MKATLQKARFNAVFAANPHTEGLQGVRNLSFFKTKVYSRNQVFSFEELMILIKYYILEAYIRPWFPPAHTKNVYIRCWSPE